MVTGCLRTMKVAILALRDKKVVLLGFEKYETVYLCWHCNWFELFRMNSSTPSSPQMSEAGDYLSSSGMPTPLTTPDTPNAKPNGAFSPR